jgi:hypothetical protein
MAKKIFLISIFLIAFWLLFFNFGRIEAGEEVKIDKTPPNVSVTGAPADWQSASATANISCTDPGAQPSGCNSATYRLRIYTLDPGSNPCPTNYAEYTEVIPPGGYIIDSHKWVCGAAQDNAGNTGFSPTPVEFKIDKDKPGPPTLVPDSRPWDDTDVSVTVTYTDLSGIQYITRCWTTAASCDPGTTETFPNGSSFIKSDNGAWTLCTKAKDGAGNWSDIHCSGQGVYQIDKDAPQSIINFPNPGDWQKPPSFYISVNDSDIEDPNGYSGLDKCYYAVFDTGVGDWTLQPSISLENERPCSDLFSVTVAEGTGYCRTQGQNTCIVYVYGRDHAGNYCENCTFRSFSIDWTPPTTSIKCNGELDCPSPSYSAPVTIELEPCIDPLSGCLPLGQGRTYYCVDQTNTCNPMQAVCP